MITSQISGARPNPTHLIKYSTWVAFAMVATVIQPEEQAQRDIDQPVFLPGASGFPNIQAQKMAISDINSTTIKTRARPNCW